MAKDSFERGDRTGEAGSRPPMLAYRNAADDPGISKFQVFAGIFLSTLILMVAVFVGVLGSLWAESPSVAIVIVGGAIVGVSVWAVVAKRRLYPGLAIGLWIGFGVTFLIEGICFSNMRL